MTPPRGPRLPRALLALVDNLALALSTLRSNPLRTGLTLVGIIIGAATVVAMMALTEGLRLKVNDSMAMLGAGALHVQKYPAMGTPSTNWAKYHKRHPITQAQGQALAERCPHVSKVSVEASACGQKVIADGKSTRPNVTAMGTTPAFEQVNGYRVGAGRFFGEVDENLARQVVVLGADVADTLFPGQDPLGAHVRLRNSDYTVIGVLERAGSFMGLMSKDSLVVVPLGAFLRTFGNERWLELGVLASSPAEMRQAEDEVVVALRRLRRVPDGEENDFEVFSNESMSESFNQLAGVVAVATFAVCLLSLLVGGIGVMNVMLVSVVERTREIGVRMALGARRRRVLAQFILEAVVLSLCGGLSGVALGAGLVLSARAIWEVPASIPAWAVGLALGAAAASGLTFGIYPALRASRLDPVEAMRTE